MPRRKPYTELGVRRVPCARCGKPSRHQWQICALDNLYHGVCADCDVDLNAMVLQFFQVRGWRDKAAAYADKVRAQCRS